MINWTIERPRNPNEESTIWICNGGNLGYWWVNTIGADANEPKFFSGHAGWLSANSLSDVLIGLETLKSAVPELRTASELETV